MKVIVIQPFKFDGEIYKPAAAGAEPNVVEVAPKAGKALIDSGAAAEYREPKPAPKGKADAEGKEKEEPK